MISGDTYRAQLPVFEIIVDAIAKIRTKIGELLNTDRAEWGDGCATAAATYRDTRYPGLQCYRSEETPGNTTLSVRG